MNFKRFLPVVGCALATGMAFAADGSDGSFDPSSYLSTATTTVTGVVTAVGTLLAAALGLYLAFVGYRKAREALNKA